MAPCEGQCIFYFLLIESISSAASSPANLMLNISILFLRNLFFFVCTTQINETQINTTEKNMII